MGYERRYKATARRLVERFHRRWAGAGAKTRPPLVSGRALCAIGLGLMLAGCSMSIPIASLNGSVPNEDVTGSISKASAEQLLEAEDWRLAKAALASALDPQGNGKLAPWENPRSGTKGSFTPLGKAYPSQAKICRVFLGQIDRDGETRTTQGTACSQNGGDWTIAEADPWKKI